MSLTVLKEYEIQQTLIYAWRSSDANISEFAYNTMHNIIDTILLYIHASVYFVNSCIEIIHLKFSFLIT